MSKRIWLVAGLAAGLLIAGVAAVTAHEGGDAVHGAALYAENCLVCHGPRGEARLDGHAALGGAIAYGLEFTEVVAQGIPETFMGPWGTEYGGPLSEDDLADLDAYAATWAGTETPPLPAVDIPAGLAGDAAAGADVFLSNCAGCHGPAGEGRGDLARYPALELSPDVVTATRRGVSGSLMPPFAEVAGGPLTEAEIGQIAAYVRTWERPSAMQVAAEASPEGAGLLILLIGMAAIVLVGGAVMSGRGGSKQ